MQRVPFDLAIEDDNLLKESFDQLSFPQKVTLRAFYGLPLSGDIINPLTGFSEIDYWDIIQGNCEYDDLGYVKDITAHTKYVPKEYKQLWAVIGRRAGKTSQLQSFIIAYEAALGGHEEFISPKQECVIYLIAQRLDVAQANLAFVNAILDSSPFLSKEVEKNLATEIRLKNGISIQPSPPSLKAQRGLAVPVVAMDEVSFWYSDPDSANPDFEVERAVSYSQMQFPHSKRIGISTPWSKEGLLWKYYKAGTDGCRLREPNRKYEGILTAFAPTAAFENPLITPDKLEELKAADTEAFDRESLCKFPDSVSGFLASKLIDIACEKGFKIQERPPVTVEDVRKSGNTGFAPIYVAAADPAFRNDSFAFTIVHRDQNGNIVVDLLRRWTPSGKGDKLNPKVCLAEVAILSRSYGVDLIYTDQYQLESLQQLALDMNMVLEGVDFTARSKAKIMGNMQQLFNQQKMVLLDPEMSKEAETLRRELVQLEKRITQNGSVQISAPENKHDDMAMVLALATFKAVWQQPMIVEENKYIEPSIFELGLATIKRNNQLYSEDY